MQTLLAFEEGSVPHVSSRVFVSKTNTPSRVTRVQRGIRISRALHARKCRAPLSSFPLAPRAQPGAFTGAHPVAVATRKNGATSARAPFGAPRGVSVSLFEARDRGMKGEPPVTRLPGYARRARPKSPYMLKQLRRRMRPREGERTDEERLRRDLRVRRRIDARAHIHAQVALVAPTLETRVSFYFLLRTREGRFFWNSSPAISRKRARDPPESSSTSRILRSARLRVAPFSFFNFVGKQSRGERSPNRSTKNRAVRGSRSRLDRP